MSQGHKQRELVIATPCPVIYQGIASVLENDMHGQFSISRMAPTPEDAREAFKKELWGAIVDLALGCCEPNFSFISEVHAKHPSLRIVSLSCSRSDAYGVIAARHGALQHLTYYASPERLCSALESISNVHGAPIQKTFDFLETLLSCEDTTGKKTALTARQSEIFLYLGLGKTTREIAQILEVRQEAVARCYRSIRKRTGYKDMNELRYQAVRAAVASENGSDKR